MTAQLTCKTLTVVALIIALFDMPFGYYQLLRVAVFLTSIYLAIQSYRQNQNTWMWAFAASALIYNPINPLALGRELWSVVNIVTVALLALSIISNRALDPPSRR